MYQTVIRTNLLCNGRVLKWDFYDLKYVGLVPDLGKFLFDKEGTLGGYQIIRLPR